MKQKISKYFQTFALATTLILVCLIVPLASIRPADAAPAAGRTSVDGVWGLAPQTIALSGDQTLTPTVSSYLLAPTSTMTLTLSITDAKAGDFIFFVGTVSTDTVIVDTGATAGGGARTISNADIIGFIYDAVSGKWLEAFYSDNS